MIQYVVSRHILRIICTLISITHTTTETPWDERIIIATNSWYVSAVGLHDLIPYATYSLQVKMTYSESRSRSPVSGTALRSGNLTTRSAPCLTVTSTRSCWTTSTKSWICIQSSPGISYIISESPSIFGM